MKNSDTQAIIGLLLGVVCLAGGYMWYTSQGQGTQPSVEVPVPTLNPAQIKKRIEARAGKCKNYIQGEWQSFWTKRKNLAVPVVDVQRQEKGLNCIWQRLKSTQEFKKAFSHPTLEDQGFATGLLVGLPLLGRFKLSGKRYARVKAFAAGLPAATVINDLLAWGIRPECNAKWQQRMDGFMNGLDVAGALRSTYALTRVKGR